MWKIQEETKKNANITSAVAFHLKTVSTNMTFTTFNI